MRNKLTTKLMLLLLAGASALFFSCTEPQVKEDGPVELSVPLVDLLADTGQQFIRVKADGPWSLDFSFDKEDAWACVDKDTGEGDFSGIVLSWEANTSKEQRSFILKLSSGSKTDEVEIFQAAKPGAGSDPRPTDLKADIPGKWMELPATNDKELYFFVHNTDVSGKKVRNWSFYYDPRAKLSSWVAYPLNKTLIGSGSRTDNWGLDPKVPQKHQQILYKGYGGRSSGGAYFQRGHQLPSADRLKYADNSTTFYFTNMTPQLGELNEKAWASLEGRVRDWSKDFDTLYVVTGADFRNSTEVAFDNNGSEIPVPTGYYKALLGFKKSLSIGQKTKGYIGIAFYYDHKAYSNFFTQKTTIDALEAKLGIDFFVNLPTAVGEETSAKIESEVDPWWK